MEISYKHTYKLYMKCFFMLIITNRGQHLEIGRGADKVKGIFGHAIAQVVSH
jgi:hypothetical protein